MKYYLLITEIEPNFTYKTIIAATSAAQALDTMKQIAAPFGYQGQDNLQQLDRDTAAEMAKHTCAIRAVKTPRVKQTIASHASAPAPAPASNPEPMKPEQQQELAEALEKMDDEAMQKFLNFLCFLTAIEQQPHLTF